MDREPRGRADGVRRARALAGKIKEHRKRRGMSIRDLAQSVGMSPSMVSRIERGTANPSVETLASLAAELDFSLDDDTPAPAAGQDDRGHGGGTDADASVRLMRQRNPV